MVAGAGGGGDVERDTFVWGIPDVGDLLGGTYTLET